MHAFPVAPADGPLAVIIVVHESGHVIEACLASLPQASTRRTLDVWVVDNASTDDGGTLARRHLPTGRVIRLDDNRGFSAGVNAGLERAQGAWIAILNPDVVVRPGALDRLADVLAGQPRAALAAPRVRGPRGRSEASVGHFPSSRRERNHALSLDRLSGREGRTAAFPDRTAPVDWASGCAWLLRTEAVRDVGPLDENFFMYFDDVDYCRRLWNAGWAVVAVPDAEVDHCAGHGSKSTPSLPAEGGTSPLQYFAKHLCDAERARATRWLLRGWRLRALAHGLRGSMGHEPSVRQAARYQRALDIAVGR
jgi:GT2 family glycosyltransferase